MKYVLFVDIHTQDKLTNLDRMVNIKKLTYS